MNKEENKYYTPEIEEFHVGFECELHKGYNGGAWVKLIVGQKTETGNGNYDADWCVDNKDKIRVKYLDREDIESCGAKYVKTHGGLDEDYFEFNDDAGHYIDYDYDKQYGRIAFDGDGDVTRFSGIIKNKSELKRILKMIGI